MIKILTIIGARPQFIKAAMVSRAILRSEHNFKEIIVHTGQHYDANMSEIFFEELKIPYPNYNLGVGGGTHGQNTGRMLEKLEELMQIENPDWVLVYGDTDSTLAGALAAAKLCIPVVHVEAGLRSFNRKMPEEINRILTDHIATMLLAPTHTARQNLLKEGVEAAKIHVVGDVMYDAALHYRAMAVKPGWFDDSGILVEEFFLCTIHRAENTDSDARLKAIIDGLEKSNIPVILPLHPRTKNKLQELKLHISSNIKVVDPVGYLEMVWLEVNSKAIVTDSGGVQKEAYFHKKPCITLRDETEWVELVENGFNVLVGANTFEIINALNSIPNSPTSTNLYGDGCSSEAIVELLKASKFS